MQHKTCLCNEPVPWNKLSDGARPQNGERILVYAKSVKTRRLTIMEMLYNVADPDFNMYPSFNITHWRYSIEHPAD